MGARALSHLDRTVSRWPRTLHRTTGGSLDDRRSPGRLPHMRREKPRSPPARLPPASRVLLPVAGVLHAIDSGVPLDIAGREEGLGTSSVVGDVTVIRKDTSDDGVAIRPELDLHHF